MKPPGYTERAARLCPHGQPEVIKTSGHGFRGNDLRHVFDCVAGFVSTGKLDA